MGKNEIELDEISRAAAVANTLAVAMALSVLTLTALTAFQLVSPVGRAESLFNDTLLLLGIAQLLLAPVLYRALFRPKEKTKKAVSSSFLLAIIVSFVLRETAGIFGFLLYLLYGETMRCYTLAFAAIVSMLIAWPRRILMEEKL